MLCSVIPNRVSCGEESLPTTCESIFGGSAAYSWEWGFLTATNRRFGMTRQQSSSLYLRGELLWRSAIHDLAADHGHFHFGIADCPRINLQQVVAHEH